MKYTTLWTCGGREGGVIKVKMGLIPHDDIHNGHDIQYIDGAITIGI